MSIKKDPAASPLLFRRQIPVLSAASEARGERRKGGSKLAHRSRTVFAKAGQYPASWALPNRLPRGTSRLRKKPSPSRSSPAPRIPTVPPAVRLESLRRWGGGSIRRSCDKKKPGAGGESGSQFPERHGISFSPSESPSAEVPADRGPVALRLPEEHEGASRSGPAPAGHQGRCRKGSCPKGAATATSAIKEVNASSFSERRVVPASRIFSDDPATKRGRPVRTLYRMDYE